jgi:hypothetical protein
MQYIYKNKKTNQKLVTKKPLSKDEQGEFVLVSQIRDMNIKSVNVVHK